MLNLTSLSMLTYAFQILSLASAFNHTPRCKATPGTKSWPSVDEWASLNRSLSGHLIKTTPPGAVCHPTQPTFNALACPSVQAGWLTTKWHTDDPVSSVANNWNNNTCLPVPTLPCSGDGYPVYVVNATRPEYVKRGVDFARKHQIRLVVKGTGHDFLGRSSGPNSLSIWTHYMRGLTFHEDFKPKKCRKSIDGHAITASAGSQMLEINQQAHSRNLTIVSGGAETVGVGGYLTGGGHAALSSTYGMGADQVLEMEIVTPGGEILTINECQNTDLFWAFRGGGGSTFGVITSVTIRAFPSTKFATASIFLGTSTSTEDAFWDTLTYVISRYPELSDQGISAYSGFGTNVTGLLNLTVPTSGMTGTFMLPLLHPTNSSDSLAASLNKVFDEAAALHPREFLSSVVVTTHDSFWDWYKINNGPLDAGKNQIMGSRLLDEKALVDREGLKKAYKTLTSDSALAALFLVGGKGVWNSDIRGGSNAVNPSWRSAYVHSLTTATWDPFDSEQKIGALQNKMTNVWVKALRDLAPHTGSYINEADVNEPNFQQAFWGANYARLLKIKRKYDPNDVLWCNPCVGNEGWELVDGVLCEA